MTPTTSQYHAVVLGGSMAGLLAARVLSNHFDHVTIVERDLVHDQPESRKGQPQTRHLHGLLANGLDIMTRYYPDLPEALTAGGALVSDAAENMQWYTYGGYRKRFHMGLKAAFIKVMNLLAPPSSLMTPGIMLRVWQANRRLAQQVGRIAPRSMTTTPKTANESA